MTKKLTRREALKLAVLGSLGTVAAACSPGAGAPAASQAAPTRIPVTPTRFPTQSPATSTQPAATLAPEATQPPPTATPDMTAAVIGDIAGAASAFLASLGEAQRAEAAYAFDDAERLRWHWTTPRNFPRNGLALRSMEPDQRDLAFALLRASVSDYGFQKALDIISLQNDLGNDPELYYVTVFGTPGGAEPWGWRFEGHHLSRHITVADGRLSAMPFFLGAWPTVSNAGLKAMEREEWAARELATSLLAGSHPEVVFQERAPGQHLTWNEPFVSPLDGAGVLAGEFNADQQALMLEVIQTYLGTLPGDLGSLHFERLAASGLENVQFAWAGPLEPQRPHYYRLQGPDFLLEFDNTRGGGVHIHSVWRDFAEDFGQHLA
jgi:hypothetical protein